MVFKDLYYLEYMFLSIIKQKTKRFIKIKTLGLVIKIQKI